MGECQMCEGAKKAQLTFAGDDNPRTVDCPFCTGVTSAMRSERENAAVSDLVGELRSIARQQMDSRIAVERAADEIQLLQALIDSVANAFMKCQLVKWKGDIADTAVAIVEELDRCQREDEIIESIEKMLGPTHLPTLTEAEREAIEWYAGYGRDGLHASTLRNLLERLK